MNEFILKVILEGILAIIGGVVFSYLCIRFARPPVHRDGVTLYSVNRFTRLFLVIGGITLCSFLLGLTLFVVIRDGVQNWGTAFFAVLTLAFAFIFFKGAQELSVAYAIDQNRLSVMKRRKQTTYELCHLELISDRYDGLVLRDAWGEDFLVSSYVDEYPTLKRQILDSVR